MSDSQISLSVPADPMYARSVRMMAANLAVLCSMSVDDVEDARMAAEEAFVYTCATSPAQCDITFSIKPGALGMTFTLGDVDPTTDDGLTEQVGLAQLLLDAVSDSCEILPDRSALSVVKLMGSAYAE